MKRVHLEKENDAFLLLQLKLLRPTLLHMMENKVKQEYWELEREIDGWTDENHNKK